ncbi:hypothetical protein Bca52824_055054 [Brassica carinata]|uniref:Uncharacterized protein n=1 Tax=Brassica carinata TaxID=52824 RepID=A0A8X7R7C5_BRACI|nr:hypothetical protein Bca52824_055054 [Brassica carinata]
MVNALDLQSFILRARVLKLYRQALKIAHRAPPQARGLERIKQLDEMLHMQGD